jgi:outer membrane protein OmpA-like peptidoglycan-associated protein
MPAKPILDQLELEQVQKVEAEEQESVAQHSVPALEGDFLQDLGRRAVRITLSGVLTGPDAGDGLKQLREKFRNTQPVSFIADIATATSVGQVLLESLDVRELAGKPERFEYGIALREFIPPPVPNIQPPPPPPPPPPPIDPTTATLVVEVIVDGQPSFDFSTVTVTATITKSDGSLQKETLTNRTDNQWTEGNLPAGAVSATATASAPTQMSGTASGTLQPGQTTKLTIHLAPGVAIAQTFVIHFAIDKAFIEPCMRPVLRDVANFANNNPNLKMLILGNTDLVGTPGAKTGSDPYNQSLSERRARSVYAYLTIGRDSAGAVAEWGQLRHAQKVDHPTINDNWGLTQAQYMLQDLDFYPGAIDGVDGPLTREAIRAFRCHVGLPPGNTLDDQTWDALIQAYLGQDQLAISESQFFPNCGGEILKWTGCASQDPVKDVPTAWRPNRRVEVLFANANSLPCTIPQPDTFNLPAPGAVNSNWCVGPGDVSDRTCFVVPHLPSGGQPKGNEWLRQPAQPGTITVQGTITFEDGSPYASQPFVIIAPDGTNEANEKPTGQPVPARTKKDDGSFQFPSLPVGFYSLEVRPEDPNKRAVLVRLQEADSGTAKGPSVCKFLQSDTDQLNVVILNNPPLRGIQLQVVVHKISVLNPVTHALRSCPSGAGGTRPQANAHSDDEIRAAFAVANNIWGQARISFVVTDIVQETCTLSRVDCDIDDTELGNLFSLAGVSTASVVNVFFVGSLARTLEAGDAMAPENVTGVGNGGCAIPGVFHSQAGGSPVDVTLDANQTAQALAHQLGRYLNLPLADDTPSNAGRLMLPGTGTGDNRTLTASEATNARASQGANDDCVPLTLKVTGATRVGGTLSNRFIVIQSSPGPVTVDAQIPDRMLDPSQGTLAMDGGDPGANAQQRTVSTQNNGTFDVTATYTPAGGGQPITRHVFVLVSNFQLQVDGATQVGGAGSTTFVAIGDPGQPVTITASLDPAPFAVPSDLVVWTGGDGADDPQRRTLSRTTPGQFTVSAQVAGVTKSVTISVTSVQIVDVGIIGKGQNSDVAITITPSPLPAGLSLTMRLEVTSGTGDARFASNNSQLITISQTTTLSIRGLTESSDVNNIRLSANLGVTPVAQRTVTVVAVTIDDIVGIKKNETRDVTITILPSPLPAGSLTAELKTTTGTGSVTFTNGAVSAAIAQTGPVSIKGITESSVNNNIRLLVRPSTQTVILAQQDFTVLNKLNFFLRFEIWNETTHVFDPLPAGVDVDLIDKDPVSDDLLQTVQSDAKGRVLFSLADFGKSGEQNPDLFFEVHTNKRIASGHTLPDEWSTDGWKATDGTPGLLKNFSGVGLGSEANPVVFRIGVDFHVRLIYLDERKTPPVLAIAAIGTNIIVRANSLIKDIIGTDANGEVHGVTFDVSGGDSINFRVDFSISGTQIKLQRSSVDISAWNTSAPDSQATSIGTQTAPFVLQADGTDHRNRALFILKNLRELATFLFHLTGGSWPGFGLLTIEFSSVLTSLNGQVPFSWPVGTVQMPDGTSPGLPAPHLYQWDRGTHIHEISHQTMWKELNFSSADIAFKALFGSMVLTHFLNLLSNADQALIEGWAEFFEAVFARTQTPPYNVSNLIDKNQNPAGPLGPPPNNQGEKVEGALANGLWAIFQNQVVTAAVTADSLVLESVNGDVTVTNPWLLNNDVRNRFLAMIWNPFVSLASASPQDAAALVAAILAGNPATQAALKAELQPFNMALP